MAVLSIVLKKKAELDNKHIRILKGNISISIGALQVVDWFKAYLDRL